jgi:hypothetical protein
MEAKSSFKTLVATYKPEDHYTQEYFLTVCRSVVNSFQILELYLK